MPAVSRFSSPPPHNTPPPEYPYTNQPGYPASGQSPGFYPLEMGRAVSLSFHMYRFAWRTLAAISVLTSVPIALVTTLAGAASYGPMLEWQRSVSLGGFGTGTQPDFSTFPWQTVVLPAIASLIVGPLATLGAAALIDAIATIIGGGRPGVRRSFAAALRRWRDLLLVFVVLVATGIAVSLFGL